MNEEEYLKRFESDEKREIDSKHLEAFKLAVDTRKFEIELYWKRAAYFWTFIAVTFAGYGVVYRLPDSEKGFLDFFLACFGLILSLAWYFANRGSKQWQENWEHHVDHLEDKVTGPLYKLVLRRARPTNTLQWIEFFLTGPSRHSVSKINQLISLYVVLLWGLVVWKTQKNWNLFSWTNDDLAILIVTVFAAVGVVFGSRTYSGEHSHHVHERDSKIGPKSS